MKRARSLLTRKGRSATRVAGFSTVEAVLAASVFAMIVTAFTGAYLYGEEASALGGNRARAALLAEEGLEAARNLRDADFTNLADGTHGLAVSGGAWIFTSGEDTEGIFTRRVEVATMDASRKRVTSTVFWQQNPQRTGTVTLVTELANWLVSVGGGDWSNPFQEASQNSPGTSDGWRVATQGDYAYLIRNSGSPNFLAYDISVPSLPFLAGSLTLTGTPTDIAISGNFVYVANRSNTQELQIVNVSSPSSPAFAGSYDAPGSTNANGVFAVGTTAYLVRDSGTSNEFVIVNAANPAAPALVGSLNLGATANGVTIIGNYAYVASGSNTQEVQVVSLASPGNPALVGSLDLNGRNDAMTIAGSGNRLIVGRGSDLHTVSFDTPTVPMAVGWLPFGGTINDIALNAEATLAFIGTGVSSAEFQIADLSTFSSPALLSTINLAGSVSLNGVAYHAALDRVVGVSSANTEEFLIFAPQ